MEVGTEASPVDGKKRLTLRDILSNTLSLMAQIIVQGRSLSLEDEESYESDWLNFKMKCWKSVDKKITKMWSTTNSPTSLSVDVYSEYRDAEKKDPTLHHLEQWNISYDTTPNESAKDKTINSKKTVILLRTLYSMIRQLPIYKLIRNMKSQQSSSNLKQNNNHFNIKWNLIQRPGTFPNSFEIQKKPNPEKKSPRIDVWDFGHINTKFGSLSCHVKYIADFSSHLSLPRTIIPYIIADYSPPSSSSPIQILTPSATVPNNLLPSSSSSSSSTSAPRPISTSSSTPTSAARPIQNRPGSSLESSFHQIQSPTFTSSFPSNNNNNHGAGLPPSPTSPGSEPFTSGSTPGSFSSSSLPKSPSSVPLNTSFGPGISNSSFIHLHQDPLISLAAVDTWSSSPPTQSMGHLNSFVSSNSLSTSPGSPPAFLMELESSSSGPFALNVPVHHPLSDNHSIDFASNTLNSHNVFSKPPSNLFDSSSPSAPTVSGVASALLNPLGNTSELVSFLIMCNQPRTLNMFSRKKPTFNAGTSPNGNTKGENDNNLLGIEENGTEVEKRNLMSYSAEIVQLTNFAKLAGTSPKNNGIITQMAAHLLTNTTSSPTSSSGTERREEVALVRARSQPDTGGLVVAAKKEEGATEETPGEEGRRVGMQRKRSSSLLTRIMLEKPKAKSGS
eukprot:TRINITY_DN1032_c0_g1_i1.p1 TRINITY_DN1032_c0_g1~~TRINITY_DN1032_c0_g1_i1.p1  ORF type:complete len:672 (+),score=227.04 TRINITY_DN1032_c0_g1_i1:184-2199(+)